MSRPFRNKRKIVDLAAVLSLLTLVVWAFPRCGSVSPDVAGEDGGIDTDGLVLPCLGLADQVVCQDNQAINCGPNGEELFRRDCHPEPCVNGTGCVICLPNQSQCQDQQLLNCNEDMMGWNHVETCRPDLGTTCDAEEGACVDLCEKAARDRANVGCDYLAVDMANEGLWANDGCFAVIVSNVQPEGTAIVTVEDAQGQLVEFPGHGTERHIPPGELVVLVITGAAGICNEVAARTNATTLTSGVQPDSTYRIRSTLPVVAYQINPYAAAELHTTDASLLIPVTALGTQYVIATYPGLSRANAEIPGTISIVAVQDGTTVTVVPSVELEPGGDVPADGTFNVTLNAREHLQILGAHYYDLTNTKITATGPVAVFAGGICTDVPLGMGTCDHIEEQIPPVNSWGTVYVAATPPRRSNERAQWRVIAAVDGTQVFVDPYNDYNTVLNQGDILEIDEPESFLIQSATTSPDPSADPPPILVVNYLKGAEATAAESGTDIWALGNLRGDPAMTLSVPVEQYMNSYVFLADSTYAYNYVVVVRVDPAQPVYLDCLDPIPEAMFQTVAGDYQRAVVTLASEEGQADGTCSNAQPVHRIWSGSPFGIWVYGYYQDTSYGYPGGMNLQQINDVNIVD